MGWRDGSVCFKEETVYCLDEARGKARGGLYPFLGYPKLNPTKRPSTLVATGPEPKRETKVSAERPDEPKLETRKAITHKSSHGTGNNRP